MSEEQTPAGGELVPSEDQEPAADELSAEELAGQDGQALPEREAMSSLNLNISGVENFAMPINEASALNYNSSYSVAAADADQTVILGQAAETGPAQAGEPAQEAGFAPDETSQPAPAEDDSAPAETQASADEAEGAQSSEAGGATADAGGGTAAGDDSSSE